jgi:hypothetical protein
MWGPSSAPSGILRKATIDHDLGPRRRRPPQDLAGLPDSANDPLSYDLSWVSLADYNLVRSQVDRGYFFHIDLFRANVSDSVITCTNLSQADLREANLEGARLDDVLLEDARLADLRMDSDTRIGDVYWDDGAAQADVGQLASRHAGTEDDFRRDCDL